MGKFAILLIFFAVLGADFAVALNSMQLTENILVDDANCDEWERLDVPEWRAEAGAKIGVFQNDEETTVSLPRGSSVTREDAPDLYWLLEFSCREDLDAGVWAGTAK